MKFTINTKTEEVLLSRTKIVGTLDFEGATPTNGDVQKLISSQLKAKEDMVKVHSIYTKFGAQQAAVTAVIYSDKNAMKKIENIKDEEKKEESSEGEDKPAGTEKAKEEPKAKEATEKKEEPAATEKKKE